jgi:hypothetical protein
MLRSKDLKLQVVLCVVFATIFALGAVCFFLGREYAISTISHPNGSPPSSTSGLNILLFIFIPAYIAFAGFVGGLLGFLLSKTISYKFKLKVISFRKTIYYVILPLVVPSVLLFGFLGFSGYLEIVRFVECDRVGLFYTDGRILKTVSSNKTFDRGKPILSKSINHKETIFLKFQNMKLRISQECIMLNKGSRRIAKIPLECDYITKVQSSEMKLFPAEDNCMALLITLRATSKRVMLLIFSPEGKIIYKEKIKRKCDALKMYIVKEPHSNVENLIIENNNILLYSSHSLSPAGSQEAGKL